MFSKKKENTTVELDKESRLDKLNPKAREIVLKTVDQSFSRNIVIGTAQAAEALMLFSIGIIIFLFYVDSDLAYIYVPLALGVTVCANLLFNLVQSHSISAYRRILVYCSTILLCWSGVFVFILVALFVLKQTESISRFWIISYYISGSIALILFRVVMRNIILQWTAEGKLQRRAVIVGGGQDTLELIEAIGKDTSGDVQLLGFFDDRTDERSPNHLGHLDKLGKVNDLIDFSRLAKVDLVIVAMPLSAEKRVLEMLKTLWVLPVDIRLSAHMNKLRFTDKTYSYVGQVPVFNMADKPISDWNKVIKAAFDMVISLLAIVLFSPIMLGTAIAIKVTSKGPVLFKQKRYGFNNDLIEIYKFRSMYTETADASATTLVTKNDSRVTKVGKFIRKTSIDELPQLFNVLKGQLSIVGPRPHALEAKAANKLYHDAVDGYFARHKVKPGITGWAQINGWRGETDTLEKITNRVDHDLYYIENYSLFLDFYILVMTPISLFTKSENAF